MRFLAVLALAACGDDLTGPIPDFQPGCRDVPWAGEAQFSRPTDFEPAAARTLADWDPTGRWFFTDAFLSRSSIQLIRSADGSFVSTDGSEFERTSTQLFSTFLRERPELSPDFVPFRFSQRIANLRDDGSLRYDLAYCLEDTCTLCTARMIRAERHDPAESEKLSLIAEFDPPSLESWRTLDVKVVGNTAYVVRTNGLAIVDITDLAKPVMVGHHRNEEGANDVVLVEANGERYAVLASTPVEIIRLTSLMQPTTPTLAGVLPVEAHTVFAETRAGATRVYFGAYDGTTPVYDLTDPTQPIKLGAYNAGASYVHDLSVHDGIAYLNAWEKGFHVVDFTDPAQPVLLGIWKTPRKRSHSNWTTVVDGRRIAVHGDETYGAHLSVVDVDPASPQFLQELGTYQTREYISIHNVTAFGSKAYITYYQDGVRVLDLSNPAAPALVGYFNTWDPDGNVSSDFYAGAIGIDVDLARKLIFVADTERGLLILRDDT